MEKPRETTEIILGKKGKNHSSSNLKIYNIRNKISPSKLKIYNIRNKISPSKQHMSIIPVQSHRNIISKPQRNIILVQNHRDIISKLHKNIILVPTKIL
jgi:hypothetical protein